MNIDGEVEQNSRYINFKPRHSLSHSQIPSVVAGQHLQYGEPSHAHRDLPHSHTYAWHIPKTTWQMQYGCTCLQPWPLHGTCRTMTGRQPHWTWAKAHIDLKRRAAFAFWPGPGHRPLNGWRFCIHCPGALGCSRGSAWPGTLRMWWCAGHLHSF